MLYVSYRPRFPRPLHHLHTRRLVTPPTPPSNLIVIPNSQSTCSEFPKFPKSSQNPTLSLFSFLSMFPMLFPPCATKLTRSTHLPRVVFFFSQTLLSYSYHCTLSSVLLVSNNHTLGLIPSTFSSSITKYKCVLGERVWFVALRAIIPPSLSFTLFAIQTFARVGV